MAGSAGPADLIDFICGRLVLTRRLDNFRDICVDVCRRASMIVVMESSMYYCAR